MRMTDQSLSRTMHLPVFDRSVVDGALAVVRSMGPRTFVAVCANTKIQEPPPDDYGDYSVTSEYFSELELGEILQAFNRLGITAAHFSEHQLIALIRSGEYGKIGAHHRFVYAARGSGTDPSRSAKVPQVCEAYRIATCSPNSHTVLIAADKHQVFGTLKRNGIPTPDFWIFENGEWAGGARPPQGHKVIAKPQYKSSSIGLDEESVALYSERFDGIVRDRSKLLRQPMIVQSFVEGFEVEVPIVTLDRVFSMPAIGIQIDGQKWLNGEILTYARVAKDDYEFYPFESIDADLANQARSIAETAATALGIDGLCKIDFRIRRDGALFVTDVNALPHLTRRSSCALAMKLLGYSYEELLGLAVVQGMSKLLEPELYTARHAGKVC